MTEETAERYGVILNSLWKAGTPIPTNDIWIAASAMEHGLQILTTDAYYQKVGQVMVEHFPSQKIITEKELTVEASLGISFRRFGNSRNVEVPALNCFP